MPPKGKGRGRGGPRQPAQGGQQEQPGRPGGQQQQPDRQQQQPGGQQQQPGRPGGQQQQPGGQQQQPGRPGGQQQQPGRPGGQQQQPFQGSGDVPPQRQQQLPPGFPGRGQQPPPGFPGRGQQPPSGQLVPTGLSHPAPALEQEKSPPKAQAKPKPQTISPADVGIELRHKKLIEPALPVKPTPGRLGRPIKLITNCVTLQAPSGFVYHYDVEIISHGHSVTMKQPPPKPSAAPEKDEADKDKDKRSKKYRCLSTKKNREVVNLMVETNKMFKGIFPAYDGMKNMYTKRPLGIQTELKCNVVIEDSDNPGNPDDPRGRRTETFEVIVKPVLKSDTYDCAISLDPLHALFDGKVSSVPQEAVMALETILRHGPCKRFTPVGRSFFFPPHPQDIHPLGGGLEIWFGYHQSLRLGQWKPLVNIDLTATGFYQKGSVIDYIAEFLSIRDVRQIYEKGLRDSDIARLRKELKGIRIAVTHLRYRRKYRIVNVSRESANKLEFTSENSDGRTVKQTIAKYFETTYRRLQFPHLPCLQVNPEKKRIFIPLEVCEIEEGQHCKKKLDEKQTAEMIKFTAKPPKQRFDKVRESLKTANFNQDPCVREFGMKVSTEPLDLEGRVIEAPNVRYHQEQKIKPRDGSWDMRGQKYFKGAEIERWVLLSFANPRFCGIPKLENFASLLCKIASEQGIRIRQPENIEVIDNRRQSVRSVLINVKKQYDANLAVVVVPAMNKSVYGEVKQAAETVLGLATQCIKEESVVKKCSPPLVSNLCQKINAKTGGINNSLTPGETPPLLRKPIIIIGADVTHPGPSHEIKPSIAACVGSMDSHPSRYAVTISAQTNVNEKKEAIEIILNLKEMVLELLKAFYRNTRGLKPEKIIFYRDGVSEGQFHQVRRHEVKCIREACRTLGQDYQPGITFIVVQKRHHVRFMPQDDRSGAGKMRNIPPGTIVDNTVVHPLNFDFFLCSHFGLQGTSRPCHYTVIEDDNDFTADDLQKLTYYLCHTYVRCTKSISSPAPVQYAHLAAFRARQHLLTATDESSSASTTSSGSSTFKDLPEEVFKAIKVLDAMKGTMYFV
ncbi:protein argonaute-3 [Caerostris darwini]|uniref:Protein argonaute-3 n=1 Tax=Caerostris darwini TaxID=1538125 RepID=A0AAV4X9N8_9ARAC|nr:protein argonaute-3 [Caerostris darwini]